MCFIHSTISQSRYGIWSLKLKHHLEFILQLFNDKIKLHLVFQLVRNYDHSLFVYLPILFLFFLPESEPLLLRSQCLALSVFYSLCTNTQNAQSSVHCTKIVYDTFLRLHKVVLLASEQEMMYQLPACHRAAVNHCSGITDVTEHVLKTVTRSFLCLCVCEQGHSRAYKASSRNIYAWQLPG